MQIEEAIPVGFNAYKESVDESSYWDGWKDFSELHQGVQDRKAKAMKQLGTLGGGNHFIEVCLDTENFVWLMLHSGSRNIGKELAERHITTAKSLWRLSELPSPDLAYFIQGTPEFAAYWKDLKWAQSYAMKNREIMMTRLLKVFNKLFNHRQEFTSGAGGQLPSQLRRARRALWRKSFRHAQGRNQRGAGCVRHHSRLDGREIVHRAGTWDGRELQLLLARRRTKDVAWRGQAGF